MSDLGWWVIRGDHLLSALRKAAAGDDPDVIFAELYANSKHGRAESDSESSS